MIANRNFDECQPLTWVARHPVYLATAIAALHGVTLILSALALAAGATSVLEAFVFDTAAAVGQWHFWQFVSYAFVYPFPNQYLWTAFQLFLMARFGAEVEKFIGRKSFFWLYALLILTAPVLLGLRSFFGGEFTYTGSDGAHFAVFMAFCFIYPRAEIFFGIEARWIAALLFGINSLQLMASHSGKDLLILWSQCGVAVLWLMAAGVGGYSFPALAERLAERNARRRFSVVRTLPAASHVKPTEEMIDPILDKIARQGIGSLTRSERDALERARAALMEKDRRNS